MAKKRTHFKETKGRIPTSAGNAGKTPAGVTGRRIDRTSAQRHHSFLNFEESFIVPKTMWLMKQEGGMRRRKTLMKIYPEDKGASNKWWRVKKNSTSDRADIMRRLVPKKRRGFASSTLWGNIRESERMQQPKSVDAMSKKLELFFPIDYHYKVHRLVQHIARMIPQTISWDLETLEVTIDGLSYPGSNIVDILTFFINDSPRKHLMVFSSAYEQSDAALYNKDIYGKIDTDHWQRITIPKGAYHFYYALSKGLPGKVEDYFDFIQKSSVNRMNAFYDAFLVPMHNVADGKKGLAAALGHANDDPWDDDDDDDSNDDDDNDDYDDDDDDESYDPFLDSDAGGDEDVEEGNYLDDYRDMRNYTATTQGKYDLDGVYANKEGLDNVEDNEEQNDDVNDADLNLYDDDNVTDMKDLRTPSKTNYDPVVLLERLRTPHDFQVKKTSTPQKDYKSMLRGASSLRRPLRYSQLE